MRIRLLGLGARLAILVVFAVFFIAPVLWLILAPTKSDQALITSSPFSFGNFHHVGAGLEAPRRVQRSPLPALDRQHAHLRAERDRDHPRGLASRRATASRSASSRVGS